MLPYLRARGHDVKSIAIDYPRGVSDHDVLAFARMETRIVVTADLDFGDLVIRGGESHADLILLRLSANATLALKLDRLIHVLDVHAEQLDQLLVVTKDQVRNRRTQSSR